jgi:hypothetical protein
MPNRTSRLTAEILAAGLCRLVDVVRVPLVDVVARLDPAPDGGRPTLYLDSDSGPGDQCWAMLDVLRVLSDGAGAALDARPVLRRLVAV